MFDLKEIDKGVKLIATDYHDVDLNLLYIEKNSYLLDTSDKLELTP